MDLAFSRRHSSALARGDAGVEVIELILHEADLAIDRLVFGGASCSTSSDLDFMAKVSRHLGLEDLSALTAQTTASLRDGQLLLRDKKRLALGYRAAKASLRRGYAGAGCHAKADAGPALPVM
jgi:hypothetical protein